MMKHFSPTTKRLERCRAQPGKCKFSVHGSQTTDVSILEQAAQEAQNKQDLDTYLSVRSQIDSAQNTSLFDAVLPIYDEMNSEYYHHMRTKYDAVAKNGTEFYLTPEDNSADFFCYFCQEGMTDDSDEKGFKASCGSCGHTVTRSDEAGALLRRSEVMFFNDNEVKRTTWFHSSETPNWAELVKSGEISTVHAGSMNAAEDRVTGLRRKNDDKETWVYELRIKPEASINPSMFNDDPIHSRKWSAKDKPGVTRYMNLYEDPGSISLLMDSSDFEVIGKHRVR
jgi:hypothetical protein